MNRFRLTFKKIAIFKITIICARLLRYRPSLLSRIEGIIWYAKDYRRYQKLGENPHSVTKLEDIYPCLNDKTPMTGIDPVYFYQDTWCAKKVFESKSTQHHDIGGKAEMVGIISQFIPTTMIDIRPLTVSLPELSFVKGSILALPFKDGEISSLSCICVIEHIGLGRYGDPLDPFGSEKAFAELIRVLAPGGSLYISVPVDTENKVYFNAHRAFTRNYVLNFGKDLDLVEERYIYGNELTNTYAPEKGFGTGLFHFKRPS